MAKALTELSVQKVKAAETRQEISDGFVSGLYLVVQPSGKRGWSVRYRAGGLPRKFTLGSYPAITLSQARDQAKAILHEVAKGKDPAAEKQVKRVADSAVSNKFDAVVRRYLAEYQKPKNKSWREAARQLGLIPPSVKRGSPVSEDPTNFVLVKGGLTERWAKRTMDSISTDEILRELDKQARVQANRFLVTLATLWKFAMSPRVKLATTNPVAGIDKPAPESSRDRTLTDDELRAVWKASAGMDGPWGALVRTLILTGQRRDEVARLPWAELDLPGKIWTIQPHRSKNGKAHIVHLCPAVLAQLESIDAKCEFVFSRGTVPVADFTDAKAKLDALSGVSGWWFHDLRRTMATRLGQIGVPIEVVEGVLAHTAGSRAGLVGVYQRADLEPQRYRALHSWGRYVEFVTDDALFARWKERLSCAENSFDAQLEMFDAVRTGGAGWQAFKAALTRENGPLLRLAQ